MKVSNSGMARIMFSIEPQCSNGFKISMFCKSVTAVFNVLLQFFIYSMYFYNLLFKTNPYVLINVVFVFLVGEGCSKESRN